MEQKKFEFNEMSFNDNMMNGEDYGNECMPKTMICPPIEECPQERVCHKYTCYEVPHIIPCNTRIINHHIYKHTFTPCYTCCEENVVSNVYDQKCCF